METAGRAVVFSGTTVAIGLLALVALPLPFLRSVGYGGMLIPLISVIVAVSCCRSCSAALATSSTGAHPDDTRRAARGPLGAVRRAPPLGCRDRRGARAGGTAVRGHLAAAGTLQPDTIAKQGDAKQGLVALERSGIGSGALVPDEVLVRGAAAPQSVVAALASVHGVHGAVAPASPQWRGPGERSSTCSRVRRILLGRRDVLARVRTARARERA